MKKLLFFVSLCSVLSVFAQTFQTLHFPSYLKTGGPQPAVGEVLSDTIWNKGNRSVTFALNLKGDNANGLFLMDATHGGWLKSQAKSTNADERRLQYVLAEARLQKALYGRGTLFTDYNHVSDTIDGFKKLHSITGSMLAVQYKQGIAFCTQVLTNVTALAKKDTACRAEFFRIVSLPNHHLVEVMYYGNWIAVDPNAGTFALTFKKPNGGYYSTHELLKDTSLIFPDYKWVNPQGHEVFKMLPGDTSRYRLLFDSREVIVSSFQPKDTYQVSGEITLPPGGAMVFSYTNGLSIDTSTAQGKQYVKKLMQLQQKCSPVTRAYCDSFLNLIARNEGVSLAQAKDAIYNGKIVFYNGAEKFSFFPFEGADAFPFHPTVQFIIPPHTMSLYIGRDVKAPLFVLDSAFTLWNNKVIPRVDNAKLKYLDNGIIPPSATQQVITTSINLNAANWLAGLCISKPVNDNLVLSRRPFKGKPGTRAKAPASSTIVTPVIVGN